MFTDVLPASGRSPLRKFRTLSLRDYSQTLSASLLQCGCDRTARAYLTAARGLIRFHSGEDLDLGRLTPALLHNYQRWMQDRGLSLNTISFYMRNLRAMYNKAVSRRLIRRPSENPFSGVYTGVEVTRKRALTKPQMRRLLRFDTELLGTNPSEASSSPDPLRDALSYFLFSFYARGMSFVDLAYLKKENVKDGVIRYVRRKTGRPLEVTLTPALRQIMDRFGDRTADSPYVFPIIDRAGSTAAPQNLPARTARLQYENGLRRQNQRLKTLGRLAGLSEPLTTHAARHTWATLAKGENLPLAVISEALGHADQKTTGIYLASFERSVIDQTNERILCALRIEK